MWLAAGRPLFLPHPQLKWQNSGSCSEGYIPRATFAKTQVSLPFRSFACSQRTTTDAAVHKRHILNRSNHSNITRGASTQTRASPIKSNRTSIRSGETLTSWLNQSGPNDPIRPNTIDTHRSLTQSDDAGALPRYGAVVSPTVRGERSVAAGHREVTRDAGGDETRNVVAGKVARGPQVASTESSGIRSLASGWRWMHSRQTKTHVVFVWRKITTQLVWPIKSSIAN